MGLLTLQLPAPCKLNLCLNITGQRADGYHVLQTAFQLLDFCDVLTFSPAPRLQVSALAGVKPSDNLVYQAAQLLAEHTGCDQGVDIQLHKQVPSGAGLGGGSSDAATTLVGLNYFWQAGLSFDELATLGLALGADVPVFVHGQSAWAEGVGEQLQPLSLPPRTYVVIQPNCQISTREIFSHPGLTRDSSPITIARFLEVGENNDCEAVVRVLYPEVDTALRWLSRWGLARMTGTGSCVYIEVVDEHEAQAVLAEKPAEWFGFSAQGVNTSALHTQLSKLD
ncbi:MAG: 4-diphosphocytidyl-2-C-methyl-D-erythritol kinase [Candidatus Azotimanducaceae bacterium]|jgi:4-diphosphocytidyl-2-C-methyl-D-erythritol kinase